MIPVDAVTMLVVFDCRTGRTGLLFVPLGKVRVHGTDAGQKTLLVVVRPRLHPFGEQLDAAPEQAERAAVLLAQALHDGQQAVDGAAVGSEPVDQHRQEIAALQFAPLAEPLQHVADLRHDGRRVRVPGRVGHHHGRRLEKQSKIIKTNSNTTSSGRPRPVRIIQTSTAVNSRTKPAGGRCFLFFSILFTKPWRRRLIKI